MMKKYTPKSKLFPLCTDGTGFTFTTAGFGSLKSKRIVVVYGFHRPLG
nr:hypothetical protein [Pedobacter sp. ASV19]